MINEKFKSGFVAIVGRTNVGKSTFVNKVLNSKVSIISPKPQTTRMQTRGIYTDEEAQIVFVDTPGIHKPLHELGELMNESAIKVLRDVDLVMWMVDPVRDSLAAEEHVIKHLQNIKVPLFLVINKIDLIKNKNRLMEFVAGLHNLLKINETFYISSVTGEGINELMHALITYLDYGPKYYPDEQVRDQSNSFLISEIIREKILLLSQEEVPHSVAVIIENIETVANVVEISALIYVERDSQKKILIGKDGKLLQEVGRLARIEINKALNIKTHLNLWVKTKKNWRNKKRELKEIGFKEEY